MAVSGEVIEYKNSERKTGVLYPRGKPFFTRLSGMIDATPGQQMGRLEQTVYCCDVSFAIVFSTIRSANDERFAKRSEAGGRYPNRGFKYV